MALMMGRLYAALKIANVPDDTAREASEEVAGFENRLANVEGKLGTLTWMVTVNIGLTAAIVLKLFVPH
jgi:hypothetical protein